MKIQTNSLLLISIALLISACDLFKPENIVWSPAGQSPLMEIRQLAPNDQTLFAGGLVIPGQIGLTKLDLTTGKWEQISGNIPTNHSVSALLIDGDSLFASFFSNSDQGGSIWLSPDLGKTWPEQPLPFPASVDPRCMLQTGTDPVTLLVGSVDNGIFLTTDKGTTWQTPLTPTEDPGIQCLVVDAEDENYLIAGTRTGLYESLDRGNTWSAITNRISSDPFFVVDVEAHPDLAGCFVCIYRTQASSASLALTTDKGQTWRAIRNGLYEDSQPRCIAFHPTRQNVWFLGTVMDGVYRTDDSGGTWYPINGGLPLKDQLLIVHALTILPSNPPILFAGTNAGGASFRHTIL